MVGVVLISFLTTLNQLPTFAASN